MLAALGPDDGAIPRPARAHMELNYRGFQVSVHGNRSVPPALGNAAREYDLVIDNVVGIEQHWPFEAGNFTCAQPCLEAQQDHRAITDMVSAPLYVLQQ